MIVNKRRRTFDLIDLFCGAGGFTAGFALEGFEPVFAVDNDPASIRTYNANFGGHGACRDINAIRTFPEAAVVIGGPPCQGFSNLGLRLPDDPRNQLWRGFMRCVRLTNPMVFVMENVPPLLKSAEYEAICSEAQKLGYEVTGKVLHAADYGVPQKRKRAIVIGSRIGTPRFPEPTHFDPNGNKDGRRSMSSLLKNGQRPWIDLKAAIGDLSLEPNNKDWHIGRSPRPDSIVRYKCIPPGGNRWDLQHKRPDLCPRCWIRKKSGGTDLFGRLEWNKPAFTIRTEFFKPEKGRYLHPEAHRPITHREAARIQTFPDDFEFVGSKIEVAKQIGNAVPTRLAQAIAASVRRMILAYERHTRGGEREQANAVIGTP